MASFQVEKIMTIRKKTYLLGKMTENEVNIRLTDSCYLGAVGIENWFDIPKVNDKNGHQKQNVFSFVLKSERDKDKIEEGTILKLWDKYLHVVEAIYTISGVIYAFLLNYTGRPDINTVIASEEKLSWKIVDNSVIIAESILSKLPERTFTFFCELEPIHHTSKPINKARLQVLNDQ